MAPLLNSSILISKIILFEPTGGGPPAGVSWVPSSTSMVGLLYFFFCDLHKKQNIHTWNSFMPPLGGVA